MSENTNAIAVRGFMNPSTVKEGMELAAWIAKSDLAPRDYKDKPQNVLIAMQMGLEVGLSPMQSIQNIAVINGRPSIWGDAMLALVQNHRDFESIDENQSTATVGVCVVKRRGMEAQRREFTVEDAKKAGLWGKQGPWQTAPARMLKLRARAFALRDTFADALRGLQSAEEQRDIVETVATISDAPGAVQQPKRMSDSTAGNHVPDVVSTTALPPDPKPHEIATAAIAQAQATPGVKCISLAQAKRYFAIAKGAGKTDEEIKGYLSTLGITRSTEMPVEKYEAACAWAALKAAIINTDTGEVLLAQEDIMETPGIGE